VHFKNHPGWSCLDSRLAMPCCGSRTALLREDAFDQGQRLEIFFYGIDFCIGLVGGPEYIAVLDGQRASIRIGPFGGDRRCSLRWPIGWDRQANELHNLPGRR
jgi:hypothetical protein